jgi:S-adenosylmethionine-diacylglycerol 3-amino-3-carboxypropyl transferase
MVALSALEPETARGFLGARAVSARKRLDLYAFVRPVLSRDARAFWDGRLPDIKAGALGAGVSERFIRIVLNALRLIRRGPARLARLLDCESLDEQRVFYHLEWDSIAWRALIRLMLSRRRLGGVYDPAFFDRVENDSFGEHFLRRIEHGFTSLPAKTNYFLHHMATGRYPEGNDDALPPYLTAAGARELTERRDRLTLVDDTLGDYLATQPDSSISGFALSNICEWLDEGATEALFREIVRTAQPGAIVCIRNFLGWTEVPRAWREVVVEDRARGVEMMARDRSLMQRRFIPCVVHKEG